MDPQKVVAARNINYIVMAMNRDSGDLFMQVLVTLQHLKQPCLMAPLAAAVRSIVLESPLMADADSPLVAQVIPATAKLLHGWLELLSHPGMLTQNAEMSQVDKLSQQDKLSQNSATSHPVAQQEQPLTLQGQQVCAG